MYNRYLSLILGFFALIFSSFSFSASEIYTSTFSNKALDGYDAVAYFTDNKPVKGKKGYVFTYKGAQWYFASQEHLDKFKMNPRAYAPQYGGYCAWAISNGELASGDPLQWSLVNRKLYINYNREIKNKWLKDKSGLISTADKKWPSVLK